MPESVLYHCTQCATVRAFGVVDEQPESFDEECPVCDEETVYGRTKNHEGRIKKHD